MNGIPQAVEDWIKSQEKPFTIFFTPERDIVFVWGDNPWKKFIEFDPNSLYGLLDPKRYPGSLLDPATFEKYSPDTESDS
jgi:hypothetical protein